MLWSGTPLVAPVEETVARKAMGSLLSRDAINLAGEQTDNEVSGRAARPSARTRP
jgi:hypothetical protein